MRSEDNCRSRFFSSTTQSLGSKLWWSDQVVRLGRKCHKVATKFWDHKVIFLKEIQNTPCTCTSGPQLDRLVRATPRYGVWRGITAFFPTDYLSLIIFLGDQRAPEEECLSHAHTRGSGIGTVALYGQFGWIYNHVGDTPLGMSARVFPERISSGGKMHPDGDPILLAEGPSWIIVGKIRGVPTFVSLLLSVPREAAWRVSNR